MNHTPGVVQIESRNAYGTEKWYPANKEAELFAGIAGQKTLDPKHISMIRSLGFTVEQVFTKRSF